MLIGTAGVFGCLTLARAEARPSGTGDISSACEVIHQEIGFKAIRKRVYEALTDPNQFNKVVLLSAAMQSGMAPAGKPVEMSPEAGGAFSAFGGYITGRNVELVPNERIVQAWRAASWGPGQYSIARFEFTEQGSGTKLVFDHAGFPPGQERISPKDGKPTIGSLSRSTSRKDKRQTYPRCRKTPHFRARI